ncbi:hypothetical protein EJB05_32499, partial [Eragrostis curvula]
MAALPFLLAMFIAWLGVVLLLPAIQAQPEATGYPDATAPARWTNSPTLEHAVDLTDGSAVRVLLLNNLYDVYQGPSFAAGFYCAPPCDAFLFAIYIVNANSYGVVQDSMAQVIWAANRGRPVRENATLSLTVANGLVLHDADGSLVWSAGSSGMAVAGLTITRAGNLVLLDGNNVSVWESFHHPTDSIVTGQILDEGMVLTPSMSITNFSADGQLRFTVQGSRLYAIAGSQVYYPNRVSTPFSAANLRNEGRTDVLVFFSNGSIAAIPFPVERQPVYNMFNRPPPGVHILIRLALPQSLQYMRFESDGHLRLYDMVYAITVSAPVYLKETRAWPTSGQSTTKRPIGCMPQVPISCQSVQDHRLVALSNVSYFNSIDRSSAQPEVVDEGSCKQACLHNCSCKAALFYYAGNASGGSCFFLSQLFSFDVLQQDILQDLPYNSSAYIKVQLTHPPPGGNPVRVKKSSPSIMIGVILGSIGGFIVLLLFITLLCKRRKRYEQIDEEGDLGELPGMPTSLLQEKARNDQLVELIDKNSEDMQMHRQEAVGMIKLAMWCLQIDYNKRPQMSVVVQVLEGTVEVETNIYYTFVATVPVTLGNAAETGSSAPHVASQLSGPRSIKLELILDPTGEART